MGMDKDRMTGSERVNCRGLSEKSDAACTFVSVLNLGLESKILIWQTGLGGFYLDMKKLRRNVILTECRCDLIFECLELVLAKNANSMLVV